MGSNPNRVIDKESAFKVKQEQLYSDALTECLAVKNMKKCSDEIKLEDFQQDTSPPKIWMP